MQDAFRYFTSVPFVEEAAKGQGVAVQLRLLRVTQVGRYISSNLLPSIFISDRVDVCHVIEGSGHFHVRGQVDKMSLLTRLCYGKMYFLSFALWSLKLATSFKILAPFDTRPHDQKTPDETQYDLTSLIQPLSIQHSDVYHNALSILDDIQASPSCHRLAASTLLNSCQSLDIPPNQAEESIEDIRSQYAAQLATCEITSAGSAVPHNCRSLVPSSHTASGEAPRTSGKATSKLGPQPKRQLGLCLKTLESRPQWWTSYSNNRQNAATMCQAARVNIEKGKFHVWHPPSSY